MVTNDNDKLRDLLRRAGECVRDRIHCMECADGNEEALADEIDRLLAEPAPPVQAPAGPLSHEAFLARRAMRLQFGQPLTFIEVHGPGRDYDFTAFCCDHNVQAEQCAAEWTAEVIDGLDAGQNATVNIYCDKTGRCNVCEPEDDDDGN